MGWKLNYILAETSPDIKHYVIKTQRAPRKSIFQSKKKLPLEYFIGHTRFKSLPELIERYQQEQGGLCCRLAKSSAESVIQRIDEYLPPQSYEGLGFWDIKYDDLILGEFLGKGSFGEVFVCHLGASSGAVKMAVKFLKSKDNNSADLQEEFMKETDFMKKLSHPFVVQLYG